MAQQEYDNELRGVLFQNKDRTKDSQPQMKGSCQIAGVGYWVSAWTQEAKNGQRYQSLSFQRKDEVQKRGMEQAKQAAAPVEADPFEDDIPF